MRRAVPVTVVEVSRRSRPINRRVARDERGCHEADPVQEKAFGATCYVCGKACLVNSLRRRSRKVHGAVGAVREEPTTGRGHAARAEVSFHGDATPSAPISTGDVVESRTRSFGMMMMKHASRAADAACKLAPEHGIMRPLKSSARPRSSGASSADGPSPSVRRGTSTRGAAKGRRTSLVFRRSPRRSTTPRRSARLWPTVFARVLPEAPRRVQAAV